MSRAIYSAVSGLTAEQFVMDVIGNNIANVNTIGFKDSRANLESTFSQEIEAASVDSPVGESVGLGSEVSSTQTLFTQGAFQETGVNTDIALSGPGWLITQEGLGSTPQTVPPSPSGSGGLYTRAGNLVLDSNRYLRTTNGAYVYGAMADPTDASENNPFISDPTAVTTNGYFINDTDDFSLAVTAETAMAGTNASPASSGLASAGDTGGGGFTAIRIPQYIAVGVPATTELVASFSVATDGAITVVSDLGTTRVIGVMSVAYFSNDTGLASAGNSNFNSTPASGDPTFYQPGVGPAAQTQSGTLELSNVDLAQEFSNMIITQQGFDANSKTISTAQQMLQTVIQMVQ